LDANPTNIQDTGAINSAPYSFIKDAVLVAVDCEAWIRNPRLTTEIGLASLDTRDLESLPFGADPLGSNWFSKIRGHHIRVAENMTLSNSDYVDENPIGFSFGSTEIVESKHVKNAVTKELMIKDERHEHRFRKIVLVGHNLQADLGYLQNINIIPETTGNIIDHIDTQRMWHALMKGQGNSRNPGLSNLLLWSKVKHHGMHNAGNDAMYTLQLALRLAIIDVYGRDETNQATKASPEYNKKESQMDGEDRDDSSVSSVASAIMACQLTTN
jgi:hypothetical protein